MLKRPLVLLQHSSSSSCVPSKGAVFYSIGELHEFWFGGCGLPGKVPRGILLESLANSDQNIYLFILSETTAFIQNLGKFKQRYIVSQVQDQLMLQDKQIQARIIISKLIYCL